MHTYIDKWVITDSVTLSIESKNIAGTFFYIRWQQPVQ